MSPKIRLNLIKFILSVASALANADTIQRSTVGGPSKCKSDTDDIRQSPKRNSVIPESVEGVRYFNIVHWPEYRESKNKYHYCKAGTGRVYCKKFNLCLCLSNTRNCVLHIILNS